MPPELCSPTKIARPSLPDLSLVAVHDNCTPKASELPSSPHQAWNSLQLSQPRPLNLQMSAASPKGLCLVIESRCCVLLTAQVIDEEKKSTFHQLSKSLVDGLNKGGSILRSTRPIPLRLRRAQEGGGVPEASRSDDVVDALAASTNRARRRGHRKSLSADATMKSPLTPSIAYLRPKEERTGHGVQMQSFHGMQMMQGRDERERMKVGGGSRRRPARAQLV